MIQRVLNALLAIALLLGHMPCHCTVSDDSQHAVNCCFGALADNAESAPDTDRPGDCHMSCGANTIVNAQLPTPPSLDQQVTSSLVLLRAGRATIPELHPPQSLPRLSA